MPTETPKAASEQLLAAFRYIVEERINALYRAKKYRRCRQCFKRTASADLVRLKPLGDTRYYRFCPTCAAELTKNKQLARIFRPKRRWGKGIS